MIYIQSQKEKAYRNLLRKMRFIEVMGEFLYKKLAKKESKENLKIIYEKLAQKESMTRLQIENELKEKGLNVSTLPHSLLAVITKSFFYFLPASFLRFVLKTVLEKKIYSQWYEQHHEINHKFWNVLLHHEELQHTLLTQQGGVYEQTELV